MHYIWIKFHLFFLLDFTFNILTKKKNNNNNNKYAKQYHYYGFLFHFKRKNSSFI
jgi:hypothetical protein